MSAMNDLDAMITERPWEDGNSLGNCYRIFRDGECIAVARSETLATRIIIALQMQHSHIGHAWEYQKALIS